jgi:hypothetical protein
MTEARKAPDTTTETTKPHVTSLSIKSVISSSKVPILARRFPDDRCTIHPRPIPPTIVINSVVPVFPQHDIFIEERTILINFTITNNDTFTLEGQLLGHPLKRPFSISGVAPRASATYTVEAFAPRAGRDRSIQLDYYDVCNVTSGHSEFLTPTASAQFNIGDVFARYIVTMDLIQILNTRSPFNDTLIGGLCAKTSDGQFIEDKDLFGNHSEGFFDPNLQLGGRDLHTGPFGFDIVPRDRDFLTITYLLANAGHAGDSREEALRQISNAAAQLGEILLPQGTPFFEAANRLLQAIFGANCDGTVAGRTIPSISGAQLDDSTATSGPLNPYVQNLGDAPGGRYGRFTYMDRFQNPTPTFCAIDDSVYWVWVTVHRVAPHGDHVIGHYEFNL